jgi:ATP-dependent helicase/DNAse subunit B
MRLLSGPAGSGKTSTILEQFRAQSGADVRILVPTATMAQHLQNQLAREGLVFRRSLIQTLSGFVRDCVEDAPEVPTPVLHLLTEAAAIRVAHPDFARVVSLPGFSARLAATIHEFSGAGCDSARLAAHLPEAPLADAFLAVYREVDRELASRNLATRARRLQLAAERIAAHGLRGITTLWLDGFHALPDPELAVIKALDLHADVTLTLERGADLLVRPVKEQTTLPRRRARPAIQSFQAAGIERETEEIARRILEQSAAGRPFREIGIIVRAPENYVPVLRATLSRFGIPARFYFDQELDRHPAVRFVSGAIDAMLAGWDHARTLAVLRLAPRFADLGALDRFDFDVREQTPNSGLADLHACLLDLDGSVRPGAEKIAHKLDSLATLEEWRTFSLHPKDWAARFKTLRNFFRPARPAVPSTHDLALDWRSQSAALEAFDEALNEAALALDPAHEIAIDQWWRTVKSVLRLKPLRLNDGRRNVVHVLSAYEAREWSLPVIFICGMVEKQFPRAHTQDPFFPDPARCRLHADGIRVRTAAEFEIEERALFESALDSATMLVTLSWPQFDGRGESNLKSLFLDELMLPAESAHTVRPPLREPAPVRASAIADPALLPILRTRTATISPTGLESFLQCPFQFFAGKTLRLRPAPDRPEDRLDFLTQGNIVHEVLKDWWNRPQDIGALFERVFARTIDEKHVPFGYHSERLRNQMLDDLRRFAAEHGWQRDVFTSRTELDFELPVGDFLIRGKIDRLDTSPDGRAYVIDYKYGAPANVKKKIKHENLLQAPLYMVAARDVFHVRPEGMFYVGVKKELIYVGWSDAPLLDSHPLPENWLALTRDRALDLVAQIRFGRIAPHPADQDNCRFCDYRDACRIEIQSADVGQAILPAAGFQPASEAAE